MEIVINNILLFFGDKKVDYRSVLKLQADIQLEDLILPYNRLIKCEQTHSDLIQRVSGTDAGAGFTEGKAEIAIADGLITTESNLFLVIRTADCYPVLFYDEIKGVVGGVHSGREGTRKNITGKMIRKMIDEFDCKPENIKIFIGPGICTEHYEVDQDTFDDFVKSTGIIQENRKININKVLYTQILKEKIPVSNIHFIPNCTYEDQNYYSFRRDQTKNRQLSIIGILNDANLYQ